MTSLMRIAMAAAATLLASLPATAGHRWGPHPPIFVATPSPPSAITPYVYPYGGRYRYNSPGPVYYQLDEWWPHAGCGLWRYNYIYWTCG
jgi:hypothetical protein